MLVKLLGLFALFVVCSAQSKVPVYVYYESLCPDSQAFITKQLYPALKGPNNLFKYVDLKFVPFGKSNYSTQGSDVIFTCHHGPNECYGNKLQSCAIEHIQVDSFQQDHTRESLTLEYINCLMSAGNNFPDSIYPGEKCAKSVGVKNYEVIQYCANSTEGSKSLQKNGELTMLLKPGLTNVPTITFKQQFDSSAQAMALTDFFRATCNTIQPAPVECRGKSDATQNMAAVVLTFISFMLARLF